MKKWILLCDFSIIGRGFALRKKSRLDSGVVSVLWITLNSEILFHNGLHKHRPFGNWGNMKFEFGELNVVCTDIERSLQFYHHVLGFEIAKREDNHIVHLRCGHQLVLLLAVASCEVERFKYGAIPEFSFDLYVEDAKMAFEHFQDFEVEFERELDEEGQHFFIKDPDGMIIEVIQP